MDMDNLMPEPKLGIGIWLIIFTYLDLRNQINLASVNPYLSSIFKKLNKAKNFEHIDCSTISTLSDNQIHVLLAMIGRSVLSFAGSMVPKDDHEKHVWLLRLYCPNLRKLKLLFKRDLWRTLDGLNNIKELHARIHFGEVSKKDLDKLKRLFKLERLTLEAKNYSGTNLCSLDHLKSLEVGFHPKFDPEDLADCCITMLQLRHLNMGYQIFGLSTRHFYTIKKYCRELERLAFGIRNLRANVEYELVTELPKLQHLLVWINGPVRRQFYSGLIRKNATSHPLESLVFVGSQLPIEDLALICQICSLKELDISCEHVPIDYLSNLCNLQYLHITIPTITNTTLLVLIQRLPELTVLNVRLCPLITEKFLSDVHKWLSGTGKCRKNQIKIYIGGTNINWTQLKHPTIEIIDKSLEEPILIRKELSELIDPSS